MPLWISLLLGILLLLTDCLFFEATIPSGMRFLPGLWKLTRLLCTRGLYAAIQGPTSVCTVRLEWIMVYICRCSTASLLQSIMIAKCYQCSDVTIRSLYAHALQLYSNSNNLPPPKVLAIALKYQLPGLAVLNLSTTFYSIIIKISIYIIVWKSGKYGSQDNCQHSSPHPRYAPFCHPCSPNPFMATRIYNLQWSWVTGNVNESHRLQGREDETNINHVEEEG